MAFERKIGIYSNADAVLGDPYYLETLQEKLGLNVVIIGFSGQLPAHVLRESPFDGTPPSPETVRALLCKHLDGRPSAKQLDSVMGQVGPHVSAKGDDAALRRAIEAAHKMGLEVWLLAGGWTSNDFHVVMFCPGQERVNRWYEAVYTHLASDYGVEALDITHARFPMLSYPRGMFLCTCEHCAKAAEELGYDMERMMAALHEARERLRHMPADRLLEVGVRHAGLGDVLQALAAGPELLNWFAFRTDLLARNLARFRRAIKSAAGDEFIFGVDTYPASLSLYVGHNHARWAEFSDFASPLVSHVDIFVTQAIAEWTDFLVSLVSGLGEADALQIIYRLLGYDGLALPRHVAEFALGEPDAEFRHVPLADLVGLDLDKARLYLPATIPSYPIIQGGGAPSDWPREAIEEILQRSYGVGHNGVMFQGTKSLVEYKPKQG
ncbi:MAG: hypothetical protein H5T69_05240 [Chloroflexi bacterium]|nr:hypothetical protein [Chloroflexota bacterium]